MHAINVTFLFVKCTSRHVKCVSLFWTRLDNISVLDQNWISLKNPSLQSVSLLFISHQVYLQFLSHQVCPPLLHQYQCQQLRERGGGKSHDLNLQQPVVWRVIIEFKMILTSSCQSIPIVNSRESFIAPSEKEEWSDGSVASLCIRIAHQHPGKCSIRLASWSSLLFTKYTSSFYQLLLILSLKWLLITPS